MMLAIAVRRSVGRWLLLPALFLEYLMVTADDHAYAHDWQWAGSWSGGILVLLGPLSAAGAAWESGRLRRSGARRLIATPSERLGGVLVITTVATTLWLLAAHATGMAAAWVVTALTHGSVGTFNPQYVVGQVVLLVTWTWVGSLVGWLLPFVVTPPMVAILGYVLPASYLVTPKSIALVGGASTPLSGLQPRSGLVLAQVVWFVSLVVLAAAGLGRATHRRLITIAVAAVLAAAALTHLRSFGPSTLESAEAPVEIVCDRSAQPVVCVLAERPDQLAAVVGVVRSVATVAKGAGLEIPSTMVATPRPDPRLGSPIPVAIQSPYVDVVNVAVMLGIHVAPCVADPLLDPRIRPVLIELIRRSGGPESSPPMSDEDFRRAAAQLPRVCRD